MIRNCCVPMRWLANTILLALVAIKPVVTEAQPSSAGTAPILPTVAVAAGTEVANDSASTHDDTELAAIRDYQRTGIARTVRTGALVLYPYGHSQPILTCAPLRVCIVELDSGEAIESKISGDTQRWEIELAAAGANGHTPLVAIKPHDCGLSTNLFLSTTRGRIYELMLDSPPCPHSRDRDNRNPQGVYERHVRFWYPDATVQQMTAPTPTIPAAAVRVAPSVESFNFDYKIERDKHFPWSPAAVFDDGSRCFIKLPSEAQHSEAPVLFAIAEDGTKTLMNYVVRGDTYVTDRVFRRATLVLGEGGTQQTVRLENRRAEAENK